MSSATIGGTTTFGYGDIFIKHGLLNNEVLKWKILMVERGRSTGKGGALLGSRLEYYYHN